MVVSVTLLGRPVELVGKQQFSLGFRRRRVFQGLDCHSGFYGADGPSYVKA